MLQMHTLISKK